MIARSASVILLSLFAIALTAVTAYSHGDGLDGYRCHHDRKHGGYHCHQGAFAGESFASKKEMLAALETHNQGPNDLRQRGKLLVDRGCHLRRVRHFGPCYIE